MYVNDDEAVSRDILTDDGNYYLRLYQANADFLVVEVKMCRKFVSRLIERAYFRTDAAAIAYMESYTV